MKIITRVPKTIQWAKSVLGLTEQDIANYISEGFPVLYAYDKYTQTKGDYIEITCFNRRLTDEAFQERFGKRRMSFSNVCEVILLGS